jgi:uncharacterized glyoxalase superfamily protein PhnB
MERVLGFGGFFFVAGDPAGLAAWYDQHLGVRPVPTSYGGTPWTQEAGPTVFAPMRRPAEPDDDPFFPAGHTFALNFRVADLDAMVAQLQGAGINVAVDPTTYPNGRFAALADPEGNPIQLWQDMDPEG